MNEIVLKVEGMQCSGCSQRLAGLLEQTQGIETVAVSLEAAEVRASYREASVDKQRIIDVITAAGFTVAGDRP